MVYDVHDKENLDNLGFWIEVINRWKEDEKEKKYLVYVIGNKDDKNEKIADEKYVKEGKEFSDNNNGLLRSVPALDNRDIDSIVGEGIESYLNMK